MDCYRHLTEEDPDAQRSNLPKVAELEVLELEIQPCYCGPFSNLFSKWKVFFYV